LREDALNSGKEWQLGAPETFSYKVFDFLRKRLNHRLVTFLVEKGLTSSGAKVLEAGSGPAFATSILSGLPQIELATAMDIDLEALQEARRRDPSIIAVVGDLNNLPFRDSSFDLTWNSSTLEHLPEPSAPLGEMSRITRPDGRVYVGVPFLFGPLGFQRLIPKTSVGIWIGTVFSAKELRKLFLKTGLSPIAGIMYFFRFFVGVLGRK
jgi:ubiquinone/menaquinone biosynthesis C-methylase UbiE